MLYCGELCEDHHGRQLYAPLFVQGCSTASTVPVLAAWACSLWRLQLACCLEPVAADVLAAGVRGLAARGVEPWVPPWCPPMIWRWLSCGWRRAMRLARWKLPRGASSLCLTGARWVNRGRRSTPTWQHHLLMMCACHGFTCREPHAAVADADGKCSANCGLSCC